MSVSIQDLGPIAVKVANQIFNGVKEVTIADKIFPIQVMAHSKCRAITYKGFLFIEQNPNKDTKWAEMAQKGRKILWVIKGRAFLIRVVDGEYTVLAKKKEHTT